MSYAIIRNENHKMNAVPLLERHNERLNHNYSNKDIDINRSSENYHLKRIQAESYQQEFDRIRIRQELKGNLRLHGEKQSTVICEFVITSDKEFFDRIGKERTRRFFEDAYDSVTAKAGGEQYILSAAAKNYVGAKNAEAENIQLKAECTKLKNENEELKSERDSLSGQLYQLEYEYGRFYETVADDVDFAEDNEKLKKENQVISSQVHTLLDDVRLLKEERYELEKRIEDKEKELTQTKSLLKALQEKFDRVMEFIRNHNLKEKLEEFLKPVTYCKSR